MVKSVVAALVTNEEINVIVTERPCFIIDLDASVMSLRSSWHLNSLEGRDVEACANLVVVGGNARVRVDGVVIFTHTPRIPV